MLDATLLQHILDNANDQIFLVRKDGGIVYVNQAVCTALGYSLDELAALSLYDIDPGIDEHFLRDMWKKIWEQGPARFEARHRHKSGRAIPVEVSASQFRHAGEEYSIAIVRDISGRLKTERDLVEANEIINRSGTVAFLWENKPHWPVAFVSSNVKALFGYKPEEFMSGRITYEQVIHPADRERVAGEVAQYSSEPDRSGFTHEPYRIVLPNSKVKWVDDSTIIRRDSSGAITHFQGVVQNATPRVIAVKELHRLTSDLEVLVQERTEALTHTNLELERRVHELDAARTELQESERLLRDLSQQLISRQEDERARISRDLHDQMGRIMTAMALETEWLMRNEKISPGDIGRLSDMVHTAVTELRRVCKGLRPPVLDNMGLAAALRSLVKEFRETDPGIVVDEQIEDIQGLDEAANITVFRILQESFTNIGRHSHARRVSVEFTRSHIGIWLRVIDDGGGFSMSGITYGSDRYGLLGMAERARLCGGMLGVDSEPGKGTRIVLILPQGARDAGDSPS